MILVDTSVWVDHLQHGNTALFELLNQRQILSHPFVVGELALGSLRQRAVILQALYSLPGAVCASDDEVLELISSCHLHGKGLGYVDVHLLAAARLSPSSQLWTLDKRLQAAASTLGVLFAASH
jgi:predicted nucleic acid-binding protein